MFCARHVPRPVGAVAVEDGIYGTQVVMRSLRVGSLISTDEECAFGEDQDPYLPSAASISSR